MHKETVNTFTKGMVTDTHPLTTPADILTDCLNGTLITYNGNEMILLNDMGNTTIGSAALPEGYIPVGITEYGGIIYIASYNPSTRRGQIGSFPSPLLAHMAEMWTVNIDNFTLTAKEIDLGLKFYDSANSEDITRTEYRAYLGLNENGLDIHILHTGDKIQIKNENLLSLKSCVQVLFGIIKKDGSIEIVEGNYLDGEAHVYTGKSSGYPLIIFKLLTLRSFNLERKYSRGTSANTVNIKFIGKPEKEDPNTEVTLRYEAKLSNEITGQYEDSDGLEIQIENLQMDGIFKYTIIPRLNPQGNLISMTKSGNIDLSKFKSDSADLRNWSYLVLDSYMKINWSFDYYNLDNDKEIRKVQFRFKPITNPTGSIDIDIEKDSFNGSFEEIINFDNGIHRNDIYVVEIVGFKGSSIDNANLEVHLGNRMVYTSGIFNAFYGKVKDFTNTGFTSDLMWKYDGTNEAFRKPIKVKITPTIKVTKTTEGNNIQITDPLEHVTTTTLENITSGTFVTKADETGNGLYVININNKYHFEVELKAKVILDLSVVGTPAEATIKKILESFTGSKLHLIDESKLVGTMPNSSSFTDQINEFLEGERNVSTYTAGTTYNTGTLTFETDLELASLMKVKSSDVKTTVVDKKGLKPLYYPDMDRSYKLRVFTAWNKDNPLFCAGADENNYIYNATLAGGNVTGGVDSGAGCDDTGLCTCMEQMGKPMVSMAAGIGGDEASYSPDDNMVDFSSNNSSSFYYRRNVGGWRCSSNEIDGGDNFLIAVWKQTDEKYRFTLLASLKQSSRYKNARIIRLDYMLRSLLSQIFTKLVFKDTIRYITTNNSEYSYYQPSIKVNIDLESSDNSYNNVNYSSSNPSLHTNYDILLLDKTIEEWLKPLLYAELSNTTGVKNNELMTVKYDYQIEIDNCETTFATDFGTTDISYMLSGSNYLESIEEVDDMSSDKWIYTIDWTAVDAAGKNNIYEILSDNTFKWKVDDMTPYLKLSGTKDGSGYAFVDESGNYKVKVGDTISNLEDPLTGDPSSQNVNVATNYNTDANRGGYMATRENYGDILRTWDEKVWPFYHSFQHVFKTYCLWKSENVSSDIFNEIVINRDSGHIGEYNARGMWRHNLDEDAPDMVRALGNSYNSIYGRYHRLGGILLLTEDSSSDV